MWLTASVLHARILSASLLGVEGGGRTQQYIGQLLVICGVAKHGVAGWWTGDTLSSHFVVEVLPMQQESYCISTEGPDLLGVHRRQCVLFGDDTNQPSPVVEVVKEDAPKATCLLPVLDQEVLVTPLLELGEESGVVPVTHILVGLVEVLHILWHNVAGGDVSAATKPPLAGDAVPLLSLKVPVCVRVGWGGWE